MAKRLTKRPGVKTQWFVAYMGFALLLAVLLISIFLAVGSSAEAGHSLGIGVAAASISGAAGALGAAAGFLFGLPRARFADDPTEGAGRMSSSAVVQTQTGLNSRTSRSDPSTPGATPPAAQDLTAGTVKSAPSMRYLTNSNLIKVSDWLTTIIIGLGLVNLAKLIPAIRRLGNILKEPLGGTPYAATIGVSLVIGVGTAGFLLTYLWTSIRVRELLEDSERQTEKDVVPQLEQSKVRRAMEDIAATSLQLTLVNTEDIKTPDLEDAIIKTQDPAAGTLVSRGSRVTITAE